ncbi:MAG: hypothetical protein UY96_C0022G0016 [Parcubacteria group bacterium GW2011_GWB1_56_8]|nr:MAG: hypothetical protein UY96_C0022G0016 [Parcubacteria group bacterium GW2011_GWB1_56_8]
MRPASKEIQQALMNLGNSYFASPRQQAQAAVEVYEKITAPLEGEINHLRARVKELENFAVVRAELSMLRGEVETIHEAIKKISLP